MRNLKKFLALVLAMIMIASAAAVVSADDATFTDVAEDDIYADAIADLVQKEITQGIGNGEFGTDAGVERYQMALFIARAATGKTDAWDDQIVPFTDVTEYTGAIYYAYANGIINGYNATTFGPNDPITYIQALKMAVAALGYDVEWEGDWMWPYYNKAVALELTKGVAVTDFNKALTRAETAQIIYNMIYAAPAEGDLTLADKNFGTIEGVGVESTFVITATPKQAYVRDANTEKYTATGNAITETHVGIQALVNGVPAGAIKYLPAADLGIADDADVEDYFNRAVTLINYDAETGAFDRAVLGDPATVVNYNDISLNDTYTAIKVAGTTYKLATNLTGSYLNNEIVVFESDINAATADGYSLIKDKDGNIINENGFVLAKLVVKNSANYYMYVESNKQYLISESAALIKFGYKLPAGEFDYADYSAMATIPANTAYELHLYDDDKDGEFERAIYLPIYISNYFTYKSGSKTYDHLVEDVKAGTNHVETKDVAYATDLDLTAGTVFTFTYNDLLNEVTVNDVIEPEIKTLKKITYYKTSSKAAHYIIAFADGSSYTMYVANSDVAIGGELIERSYGKVKAPFIDDIEAGKYLDWTDVFELVETANVGEDYVFYANNGTIFFMEAVVDAADPYEYLVFDEINDIDLDEVLVNLWFDGAYKTGAAINKIVPVYNKNIADLNAYQIAKLLGNEDWQKHGAVWASQYADGQFAMVEEITKDESTANLEKYGLTMLGDDTFGATTAAADMTFIGGHTIYDANGDDVKPVNRLYTNKDTVFYFIDTTVADNDPVGAIAVEAYKMMPSNDATITFVDNARAGTVIYTDALGIANGVAKTVIVFDAVAHNGFKKLNTEYKWLTTAGIADQDYVTAGMTYAEDLGLKGYEDGLKVYAYAGAHDLEDGSEAVIYSTFKLTKDMIYKTDKNGVVGVNAKGEAIAKSALTQGKDYGTFRDFANANGILYSNVSARDFYAYFNGEEVYVELGEVDGNALFPHTILIQGTVSAFDIPVTKIVAIDAADGSVYENDDAIAALTKDANGDYGYKSVYWVGTRTDVSGAYVYDTDSFEDGVAVFVFAK